MGYTGFPLSLPFLPLYIGQLGISDIGEIAMWTGASLAVTPALTGWVMQVVALGAPFVVGGGLKIVYDVLLWWTFRDEELRD